MSSNIREFNKEKATMLELVITLTAQKMKFSAKNFFSKCDQIWSHLLKKSLMEKFNFSAVS